MKTLAVKKCILLAEMRDGREANTARRGGPPGYLIMTHLLPYISLNTFSAKEKK